MKKVLIIGAGPAGLMAAYRLLLEKNKYQVVILEKQDKIGGLCKTNKFKNIYLDYGVHFFRMSEYSKINDIIYNLIPIEDRPSNQLTKDQRQKYIKKKVNASNTDKVMLINKNSSHIYFNHKYYDYPIKLNLKTIKQLGLLNLILIGLSYTKALIFKRKEKNLEEYYINRYGKKFYKMFFHDYTYKICGVDPKDIDIDWGKQRIRETSLINILKEKIFHKSVNNEPSLIEEYYYPKYGCGEVYKILSKQIEKLGGTIITNSSIDHIEIKNNKINKIVYKNNDKTQIFQTDYCINSIAINDFINYLPEKTISTKVSKQIKKLPFRDLILVSIILSKKEMEQLKDYQIIKKDSWVFIQDPKINFGRIKMANNWSKYMLGNKNSNKIVLTLEYCCDSNDKICKLKDEEIINLVKKELKILKLYPINGIKDYKIDKVKKAYPAYYGSYKSRKEIIKNLNKIENCYFIGRNGQHQYIDMDKAMYTGLIASENIISNKKDKENIWL